MMLLVLKVTRAQFYYININEKHISIMFSLEIRNQNPFCNKIFKIDYVLNNKYF